MKNTIKDPINDNQKPDLFKRKINEFPKIINKDPTISKIVSNGNFK